MRESRGDSSVVSLSNARTALSQRFALYSFIAAVYNASVLPNPPALNGALHAIMAITVTTRRRLRFMRTLLPFSAQTVRRFDVQSSDRRIQGRPSSPDRRDSGRR